MTADGETLVACLTPPGQGAIATLAVHGPLAWHVAARLFQPRSGQSLPSRPPEGNLWLGRLGGDLGDEVVLAVKKVEPVPSLEIHGHGGREVVRFLFEQLIAEGCRACSWQELLTRTEPDPLRAKALTLLPEARTLRTASILLDQANGALHAAMTAILARLETNDRAAAQSSLEAIARHAAVGRRLVSGWRVAIAGPPNVGKSSLVNVLAGYERSVVAPTPGTTRDVVTTWIAADGWPIELADTAGQRETAEALEGEGVGRARAAMAGADLCLWVLDASTEPVWPPADAGTVRLVVNKTDLTPAWDLGQAGNVPRVSARTGEGIADLVASLARWLVPEAPPPGAAVPFTPDLADLAEAARAGEPSEPRIADLLRRFLRSA